MRKRLRDGYALQPSGVIYCWWCGGLVGARAKGHRSGDVCEACKAAGRVHESDVEVRFKRWKRGYPKEEKP